MIFAWRVVAAAILVACLAEHWRSSDAVAVSSVPIDTKVPFDPHKAVRNRKQADEVPFKEPTDTSGFYNRPPGAGRYPVRVHSASATYQINPQSMYHVHTSTEIRPSKNSDGTLDSLQNCKCVSTPDCNPQPDYAHDCGAGQNLCCFKQPNSDPVRNSDFFNEVYDEIPSPENSLPMSNDQHPFGHLDSELDVSGPHYTQPEVLVGSGDSTGHIGPQRPVLIGPNGPKGQFGTPRKQILFSPESPSGVINPDNNRQYEPYLDIGHSGSSQKEVLIARSGSTTVGPYNWRPVLFESRVQQGDGQQYRPGSGLLIGPSDHTGMIGPRNQLLVGPGGPTGQIELRRFTARKHQARNEAIKPTTAAAPKLKTCTRAASVRRCVERSDEAKNQPCNRTVEKCNCNAETKHNHTANITHSSKPTIDEVKEMLGIGIKRVIRSARGNTITITERIRNGPRRVIKKGKGDGVVKIGNGAKFSGVNRIKDGMSDHSSGATKAAQAIRRRNVGRRQQSLSPRHSKVSKPDHRRTVPTPPASQKTTTTTEDPMKDLENVEACVR